MELNTELKEKLEDMAFELTDNFCYSCYRIVAGDRCPRCGTDDFMRHLEGVGVEYGTDWVIEHLIKENCTSVDAEEEFERTLEAVASLAVRFDRQGFAVGLVSNSTVVGGNPAILSIARNPQQLPAILETLARLNMQSSGDLMTMFRQGIGLPWGVSCVHFSYEEDAKTLAIEDYFMHRKLSTLFFMTRTCPIQGEEDQRVRGKIYRLDDLCLTEA